MSLVGYITGDNFSERLEPAESGLKAPFDNSSVPNTQMQALRLSAPDSKPGHAAGPGISNKIVESSANHMSAQAAFRFDNTSGQDSPQHLDLDLSGLDGIKPLSGPSHCELSTAASHTPSPSPADMTGHQPPSQASVGNFERLPCEFVGYAPCRETFHLADFDAWIKHAQEHFKNRFPEACACWYCDKVFHTGGHGNRIGNFKKRMVHIREHFKKESNTPLYIMVNKMRPDYLILKHLREEEVISEDRSARMVDSYITKLMRER